MDKHNPDWITSDTWYKTYICKKLHVSVFEVFNLSVRTDRYDIICSIDAHTKTNL